VSLIIKKAAPISKMNHLGNTEEGFRVLRLDESAAEVDEAGRTLQTFHRSDCISLKDPSSSHNSLVTSKTNIEDGAAPSSTADK
jgi:hypothetical protein